MKLLVITSCTSKKAVDAPNKLILEDFRDPERLRRKEAALQRYQLPAFRMYTGQQHLAVIHGVRVLRTRYQRDAVALQILSAGYGLVPEDRLIAPYEVTFKGMAQEDKRSWARSLGVPHAVRDVIQGHDLVVFLLGADYLDVIEPPLEASRDQRLVFLAKPGRCPALRGAGVTAVPTGKSEASRWRASPIALKGKMFELFSKGLVSEGEVMLDRLLEDDTPATFEHLMTIGASVP